MTAPELYLPVPRKRRERSVTPAMTRGEVFMDADQDFADQAAVNAPWLAVTSLLR